MRKVIITDLTRFSTDERVCTAAVDMNTGECIRPIPYLLTSRCAELNIQPGSILEGDFDFKRDAENPHIEDAFHKNLQFLGPSTTEEFKEVLDNTLSNSVSAGFGITFAEGQKHIPVGEVATCSIITIKVTPDNFQIFEDQYKAGKIKASFTDNNGDSYRYLSITDRGFYDYAMNHQNDGKLDEVQRFIASQQEVYLRVGVGRRWAVGERDGYWLQVNGIYTFPDFLEEIRSYEE